MCKIEVEEKAGGGETEKSQVGPSSLVLSHCEAATMRKGATKKASTNGTY